MTVKKMMDLPSTELYVADRSFTDFYFKDSVSIRQYSRDENKLKFSKTIAFFHSKPTSSASIFLYDNTLIYLDNNQIKTISAFIFEAVGFISVPTLS